MGEYLILMHELNIMFDLFGILVMHVQEYDRTFYVTKVAFLHEIAHFKSFIGVPNVSIAWGLKC